MLAALLTLTLGQVTTPQFQLRVTGAAEIANIDLLDQVGSRRHNRVSPSGFGTGPSFQTLAHPYHSDGYEKALKIAAVK